MIESFVYVQVPRTNARQDHRIPNVRLVGQVEACPTSMSRSSDGPAMTRQRLERSAGLRFVGVRAGAHASKVSSYAGLRSSCIWGPCFVSHFRLTEARLAGLRIGLAARPGTLRSPEIGGMARVLHRPAWTPSKHRSGGWSMLYMLCFGSSRLL